MCFGAAEGWDTTASSSLLHTLKSTCPSMAASCSGQLYWVSRQASPLLLLLTHPLTSPYPYTKLFFQLRVLHFISCQLPRRCFYTSIIVYFQAAFGAWMLPKSCQEYHVWELQGHSHPRKCLQPFCSQCLCTWLHIRHPEKERTIRFLLETRLEMTCKRTKQEHK